MADKSIPNRTFTKSVTICNERGLHARASAKFVKCVERFDAKVAVSRDGEQVVGTSIMGLLMLAAGPGAEIKISARGRDASQALAALEALVMQGFDE